MEETAETAANVPSKERVAESADNIKIDFIDTPNIEPDDGQSDVLLTDDELPKSLEEQNMEGMVEGDTELTVEALIKLEQEKKKKRREEKRLAHERLRKLYKENEEAEEQADEPKETTRMHRSISKISLTDRASTEIGEDTEILAPARFEDKVNQAVDEIESEEPSSSDEEDYKRRAVSVSFKGEFLQNFYFPSISDITTESSEQLISLRHTLRSLSTDMTVDEGEFVDPLTGEPLKAPIEAEAEVSEESDQEEESPSSSSSSTISFDWPFPLEDEVAAPVQADTTEYALEMLLEINTSIRGTTAKSITANEAQRQDRENRQICIDFLYKAIDDAVDAAEYVDPDELLAGKLDKQKLINDLHRIYSECLAAKQFNTLLSTKMYEYYRRIGQLRVFDTLSGKAAKEEFQRHRDALHRLDYFKHKAHKTKTLNILLLASVYMDLGYVRNISLSAVDSLENCIRNTLSRKDLQVLPRIVEHELRRMQIVRNEISDSRIWLITRQHTLGRVIERKLHFDQITPDLTMDEFLNAQTDVTALGTKVEERNRDLNRMRDRCTKHVHQLAFIREKTSMISATLTNHKSNLRRKIRIQNELRDQLLKEKLRHTHLTAQIRELNEKCGLLYKPALLDDFDETVVTVEIKRKQVNKLRGIVRDLEARIARFENLVSHPKEYQ